MKRFRRRKNSKISKFYLWVVTLIFFFTSILFNLYNKTASNNLIDVAFIKLNEFMDSFLSNNINYDILDDYRECLHEVDVFYMTRIQKERFPDIEDYEKLRGIYVINKENIEGKTKEDMIIMHPLPRVDEISTDLDNTKHALYFKQAKNGIPVRQAMMLRVLNMEVK